MRFFFAPLTTASTEAALDVPFFFSPPGFCGSSHFSEGGGGLLTLATIYDDW